MKRKLFPILLLAVIAMAVAASVSYYYSHKTEVCVKDQCFKVETVSNQAAQEKGLMYRKSLPQDQGMLFVFKTEEVHAFWMKNTYIPLDMIWINGDNKVVEVENNAPPCVVENCPVYGNNVNSKYVLEINGGLSSKFGITAGDSVEIKQ